MGKGKYESPKFDFQEMKLMERVANVCWGQVHEAWYDQDGNGKIDNGEHIFNIKQGDCNSASLDLKDKLILAGIISGNASKQEADKYVSQNINSQYIKPITS